MRLWSLTSGVPTPVRNRSAYIRRRIINASCAKRQKKKMSVLRRCRVSQRQKKNQNTKVPVYGAPISGSFKCAGRRFNVRMDDHGWNTGQWIGGGCALMYQCSYVLMYCVFENLNCHPLTAALSCWPNCRWQLLAPSASPPIRNITPSSARVRPNKYNTKE